MPDREVGERSSGASTDLLIGELIAEVRAVKHETKNNSQKLDALSPIVGSVNEALHRLERMEAEQVLHAARIAVLESDKLRREGAIGVGEWFARHWPFSLVMVALTGFIAWANGRLHP